MIGALIFTAITAIASASASTSTSASAAPSASTTAAGSAAPVTLPSGHPHVEGRDRGVAPPAFFRPPPDTSEEEAGLPLGTIRVELRDPQNNVIRGHAVELGVLQQSVAKGESRKHLNASTDANGMATFDGLENSGNIAYRVTAHEGDAVFAARPFQLGHDHGMHVVLHVYPPTSDLSRGAMIITRSVVYVEMKDDRVQIQQRIDVFNGMPVAWVPRDVILALPADFTALNSMQQMSDIGVDAVDKKGARLHGTFVPGENPVIFSWQLPYSATSSVDFEIGLPPNIGQLVVRAAAAPGMKLQVDGFHDAVAQTNEEGQRELVTGKQLQDGEAPLHKLHITLSELPTPGPARLIGTALAALGIALGIYFAASHRRGRSARAVLKRDRTRVLDEFEQLEDARANGDIGPKTYERARRELIDELAHLLAANVNASRT